MGGRGADANAAGGFGRGMGRGGDGGRGGMLRRMPTGRVADVAAAWAWAVAWVAECSAAPAVARLRTRMPFRSRRTGRPATSRYACPTTCARPSRNGPSRPWPTPAAISAGRIIKITIAGTDRTLAVGEDGELIGLPSFTGGPQQLWRIDQLTDGTWRIMPKFASVANESLYLSAVGSSFATLAKFDPSSDKQHWLFKTP